MRLARLILMCAVASIVETLPATANSLTFDWIITGPSAAKGGLHFTGSGTLTVGTGTNADFVTALTGTLSDGQSIATITGLAPAGTINGNDNLLFPIGASFAGAPVSNQPYVSVSNLDSHGIAFTTTLGTFDIFGFSAPNQTPAPDPSHNNYGEFSPTGFGVGAFAVPTPVVGAGLPGLIMAFGGMLAWRRRKQAAV
jgi:hypothetical protein